MLCPPGSNPAQVVVTDPHLVTLLNLRVTGYVLHHKKRNACDALGAQRLWDPLQAPSIKVRTYQKFWAS